MHPGLFGAPEPLEDHPERAVACAMAMDAAMDEINFLNEAERPAILEMGIVVNTGAVVVGNIGSERRTKYSVVVDTSTSPAASNPSLWRARA